MSDAYHHPATDPRSHPESECRERGCIAQLDPKATSDFDEIARLRAEVERLTGVYAIEREALMKQRDDAYVEKDKADAVVRAAEALLRDTHTFSLWPERWKSLREALAAYRGRA